MFYQHLEKSQFLTVDRKNVKSVRGPLRTKAEPRMIKRHTYSRDTVPLKVQVKLLSEGDTFLLLAAGPVEMAD